jgi:hypothetical protein
MIVRTMGIAAVALCLVLPAVAQENGRYQLERGDQGFVRLDTVTGDMTLCRETGDGLACDVTRDDDSDIRRERDQLRDELRDLRRENTRLREDLERYEDFSADNLPSEEEIEEVATWFERVLIIMARTMRNAEEGMEEEMQREGEGR